MHYNRTAFRREVESAVTVFVDPAKTYTPSRNYQTLGKVGSMRDLPHHAFRAQPDLA
jgi:hypothetical protein